MQDNNEAGASPRARRCLTGSEQTALLLADERSSGRVLSTRRGVTQRLVDAGLAQRVPDGTQYPGAYITDEGRRAVREQGCSGGRG